jgi:hypothetical protein
MKALKVLVVLMGVLILAGTVVIIAVIVRRTLSHTTTGPVALTLDEPAGTRIAGVAAMQDRLAVQLQGGGPDRVVLVDPRSGTVAGRITLKQ